MNFLLIVFVWSVKKKKDNCLKLYNLRDDSKF